MGVFQVRRIEDSRLGLFGEIVLRFDILNTLERGKDRRPCSGILGAGQGDDSLGPGGFTGLFRESQAGEERHGGFRNRLHFCEQGGERRSQGGIVAGALDEFRDRPACGNAMAGEFPA